MYDEINQWKWTVLPRYQPDGSIRTFYAARTIHSVKTAGGTTELRMHRFITGARAGEIPDHDDYDGLNNQISNLIVGTHADNQNTKRKHRNNKSGYIGVSWITKAGKWQATVQALGKSKNLGQFSCKHEAARVYNLAKRMYAGSRATINEVKP